MPDLNRSIYRNLHVCTNAVNAVLLIGRTVVDTGQASMSDDYMMTLRKARNYVREVIKPVVGYEVDI